MRKRTSTKMTALVLVLALVLLLSGCGYKEEIAQAAALIEAIGTVTLESEDAILAAEDAFAALPEKARAKVDNAATLTAARESYDEIRAAYEARQAAIAAAQAQLDALETLPLEKLADIAALEQALREAEAACAALPEEDQAQLNAPDAAIAAQQARIESEKPGLFYAALQIADEAQEWPMNEVYTLHLVSDTGEEKTVLARLSAGEDGVCRFSELFSDIELMRLSGYTPGEALPEDGVEVLEMHSFFAGYQLDSLTAKIKPELPSPVEEKTATEGDENADDIEAEKIAAELEELCILDDGAEFPGNLTKCITYEVDNQKKVVPVSIERLNKKGDLSFQFICNGIELFRANEKDFVSANLLYFAENLKKYQSDLEYFQNIDKLNITRFIYDFYGESTNHYEYEKFCELIKEINGDDVYGTEFYTYEYEKYTYTREQIAELYIKYVPEEYRVNAYELSPDQYSRSYSAAEYAAWYLAAVPETARVYAESLRAVASP